MFLELFWRKLLSSVNGKCFVQLIIRTIVNKNASSIVTSLSLTSSESSSTPSTNELDLARGGGRGGETFGHNMNVIGHLDQAWQGWGERQSLENLGKMTNSKL